MNKTKIILASVGGAVALVSLVLAYLVWDAFSVKGERASDLEALVSTGGRLARLPVYPGAAGVTAYGGNAAAYTVWREEAQRVASAGDKIYEPTTPPAFKTFLVAEAARLSALPGGVDGKIVKPGFPFGFKDYITGGVLPARGDLPRLQREWNDVSTVIEILSTCGVAEVLDVRAAAKPDAAKETKTESRRDRRRNARNRKAEKKQAPAEKAPAVTTFTIDFLARPEALVSAVNAFVSNERFIVVDGFSFTRETDEIASSIVVAKKEASTGRRGRRGRRAEPAKEESAEKKVYITDPVTAPPLKVQMTFSVYDFRTLEPDVKKKAEGRK